VAINFATSSTVSILYVQLLQHFMDKQHMQSSTQYTCM